MSLESELKKNTAALVALNDTLIPVAPFRPEVELPIVPAATAPQATVAAPNHPGQPIPPPAGVPQPLPAVPPVAQTMAPATTAPPVVSAATAPPVATTPPQAAAPADDDARKKLVAWAKSEMGKLQHLLSPQRMVEMIQAEGGAKLSDISSDRLPRFVVDAQNEAAQIQGAAPGVPQ